MELDLGYTDYTIVGLTFPNTLKSIYNKDTKYLKVAVGDQDGVLQVFSIKNDELFLSFKTLPGDPISSVDIDVSQDGGYEKIFVSSGTEVKGYTKKGKLFLALETNLSESIITMKVYGADLLVAGTHCMTHYRDCKDIGNYICGDTIIDISAIQLPNSNRVVGLIACKGGTIHAIERGRVLAIVRLPTNPCVLFSSSNFKCTEDVYCGAIDGSLYSLSLDREHGSIDVYNFGNIRKDVGISAAGWWNGQNGFQNSLLLLGYSDGCVQIYNIQSNSSHKITQLLFTHNCDEGITSVAGWSKGIVVATRSGRVLGFNTIIDTVNSTAKINKIKNEIKELEVQVEKERTNYRIATQPLSQGLSAIPSLQINEEWGPVEGDGARKLCISLGAPLDILLLQSSAPLCLLDTAQNAALLSQVQQLKGNNKLLATYRCQANTQQLEMRIGVWTEGIAFAGKLLLYITPLIQPKCCQLLKYIIVPLSWHVPCDEIKSDEEYNILTVLGSFSHSEVHSWLCRLLPDMSSRPILTATTVSYKSVITDTYLKCFYQKGEAHFKSDNVSSIAIIKDFLSREAAKKKVQLEISCSINNATIFKMLNAVHPKIYSLFNGIKEANLQKALSEIQTDNEDFQTSICAEYLCLLNKPKVQNGVKHLKLQQLNDILINLFCDSYKLKGANKKNKIPELKAILEDYNLESVLQFFNSNIE